MNFDLQINLSAVTVFIQGLLSFFSPCVLPLLPVYFGYLSGGTAVRGEDGQVRYDQRRVIINTIFFVAGIGFAFAMLGLGMSALGIFFRQNQQLLARIGGVIVILFGLIQLLMNSAQGVKLAAHPALARLFSAFGRERKLPLRVESMSMSPVTALLLGFVFSFAWTPCIGPTLSSVLVMTAANGAAGFGLIAIYTLGFVLPFLVTGLFTTRLLQLMHRHRGLLRYTVLIGAVLMIFMGILMLTGSAGNLSAYLARLSGTQTEEPEDRVPGPNETGDETEAVTEGRETEEQKTEEPETEESVGEETEKTVMAAPDFTLTDQYGNTHTLSDYQGKTVFLNFWATWCPPCKAEMPDIQELYEEFERTVNQDKDPDNDVVILGVAAPGVGQEGSEADVTAFLEENGYTYPVVMDPGGSLYTSYYITAFPTTFMIDREGNIYGYLPGMMTQEVMRQIIAQTQSGESR